MRDIKSCYGEIYTLLECIEAFDIIMEKAIKEKDYKILSLTQGEFIGTRCTWEIENGVIWFRDPGNDVTIEINLDSSYDSQVVPYFYFIDDEKGIGQ